MMPITADETVDDDLRNAVWKGHYLTRAVADVMLHVPFDRRFALRNNQAVLFGPYFRKRIAITYNAETMRADTDLVELRTEKIGVEVDSLADFFLSGAYRGQLRDNVVRFRTAVETAQALRAGQVVTVMTTQSEVEGVLDA